MRKARFLFAIVVALAAASCARQQQSYQSPAQSQAATSERGLFGPHAFAAQPQYPQEFRDEATSDGRGFFGSGSSAPASSQRQLQPPSVLQYHPPRDVAPVPRYAAPEQPCATCAPYVAEPAGYATAAPYRPPYTLDSGDKLRIVVFGQDGISSTYLVDAGGNVNMPLIGTVSARGITTQQLSQRIAAKLKQGYVREPHVTVEVETYRPFFILGEVTNPGQYPYVADMTVEKAIAIAGGFAPRAYKDKVEVTHSANGEQFKGDVPLSYPLRPGDTVLVKERWF